MPPSLCWYDFETTGIDPIVDRPIQFAALRTDLDLNPIEDPINLFCAPGNDVVPDPEAILVTGLSLLQLQKTGLNETQFCSQVLSHFSVPETCVSGYNSIRFDDEFTRQMLYRNFFDPYAREWRDSNSRWDVIDLFRMAYALRPDGLEWPMDGEGNPTFRLESLTAANHVDHGDAHDAVSDVMATVALTKLLKEKQPKLVEFLFSLRQKKALLRQLYPLGKTPMIHVSSMYGAARSCTAVVLPICSHPTNSNGVICYDLSTDADPLIQASPADVARLVFTSTAELQEGESRIALKTIHVNRCPAIAPVSTMGAAEATRLGISLPRCDERKRQLQTTSGLVEKITEAFQLRVFPETDDPDRMLYQGGFFGSADSATMGKIHTVASENLGQFDGRFDDDRLDEMLFRFRARNYPNTLSPEEQQRWDSFRLKLWQGGSKISKALDTTSQLLTETQNKACLVDLRDYLKRISMGVTG